ncbi:MAG: tyrosine--tRNA ligase [Labilithrix sp.]|nr:tyrosine--tRNA ligase [Labilithrix sp.]MCW5812908.1 tyrosine--tRNA ligase [Labilithrix sp.]
MAASVEEQLAVLTRGAVDVHVQKELAERLKRSIDSGKPLRVKCGFDPTRPDLHIGHAVVMSKMRQFQEFGHQVILLVGEFTAMVGDPTGKNEARPPLTREEVQASAKTYTDQAFKILDRDKTEVRSNSEWLDKLNGLDWVRLLAQSTVSRMLDRNDFGLRYKEQRPIHLHEFLYPLLQGYDSVALECDIELGGTDQLFNLLVGRDIMPTYGKTAQMVLTMPLLEGTDAKMENGVVVGKKMSKSADNYIGLSEEPLVMFRKVMQIDDDVIFRYFELLSARSNADIAALREEKKNGRDPREIKALFAKEIVTRFHSAEAATAAEAEFKNVYSADAIPTDIEEQTIPIDTATLWIAKALAAAGLVKSTSDGRRLVEQGGVEVDQQRVTDVQLQLERGKRYLLRVGSKNRRFKYVVVA